MKKRLLRPGAALPGTAGTMSVTRLRPRRSPDATTSTATSPATCSFPFGTSSEKQSTRAPLVSLRRRGRLALLASQRLVQSETYEKATRP